MASSPISVVGLLGTARPGNYTGKALRLVEDEFRAKHGITMDIVDPATFHLSSPGSGKPSSDVADMVRLVKQADGIVFATPEYHGGFSSVAKLMIENMGFPSAMAGKPVALLGVAAGSLGAIKSLEQLRSVCSHIGAIVLPAPVSVAGVQRVFDEDGRCTDAQVESSVRGVATNLMHYIHDAVCPKITLEAMVRR